MEARSLLALAALLLVLWLIRTWFFWDSQERMARRSRDELKRKLSQTPLIDRVRTVSSNTVDSNTADSNTADQPLEGDFDEAASLHEQPPDSSQEHRISELTAALRQRDNLVRSLQAKLEESENVAGSDPATESAERGDEQTASQIGKLEALIVERDQQLQRQEHAFQEIEKLKKLLHERNRENEILQQSSTRHDNALEQYRDKAQRAAMLEQQLAESNRLIHERDKEIAQLRQSADGADNRPVTGEASDSKDQVTLDRLRSALAESEAAAKAAHQSDLELRRLRGELNSLQSRNVLSTARINDLEKRITERQNAMAEARAEGSVTSGQLDSLKRKLDEKARQNELLQRQLDAWKKRQPGDSARVATNTEGVTSIATAGSSGSAAKTGKFASQRRLPLFTAPAEKDDLKLIKGIGPVMETTLNELGVTTFKQLANFSQDDIEKVSAAIDAFPGRIERDDWVGKAREHYREKYGENA